MVASVSHLQIAGALGQQRLLQRCTRRSVPGLQQGHPLLPLRADGRRRRRHLLLHTVSVFHSSGGSGSRTDGGRGHGGSCGACSGDSASLRSLFCHAQRAENCCQVQRVGGGQG